MTRTNQNIKKCITENPTKNYVFYFGKVDIDFILNYKYNTDPQFDAYKYVDSIIDNYFTFLKSLSVSSIFILELPVSHLEDAILLNHINNTDAIIIFFMKSLSR